jgi:glycosyltransferase involved in cell wall biosynthesis
MTARADLHVHSKHSNRPSEWILRQFGAPESFTEPREVYRRARERGMDFVTLSDHDSIAGALEIAHLPGTFLSEEVTVEFPEDGCEIHCLVWGIDEAQHRAIQSLRRNVYELRDYLVAEDVAHAVAHPLYRVNDRLTLEQLEKLLVLFNRFEALNGMHERRANGLVRRLLGALTRDVIEDLALRHRLRPVGPAPWRKTFTGGSDDHGGHYIATTFTATPPAAGVAQYLAHLRAGDHQPGGDTGSSLRLTQSLYSIAHEYYRRQFPLGLGSRQDRFAELLRTLALGAPPAPPRRRAGPFAWRQAPPEQPKQAGKITVESRTFFASNDATQETVAALVRGLVRNARRGRLSQSLGEAAAELAPLALTLAPYLLALQAQHKDADLLDAAARRFLGQPAEQALGGPTCKKAWFTDTLTDVNGVAKTVRTLAALARERGRRVVAITCGQGTPAAPPTTIGTPAGPSPTIATLEGVEVADFPPLAAFPIPGYESQRITVPPLAQVLEHCERERYSEILISTPGPLGLAGLAAGKLLGIPVAGIYHTDFPLYVRHLAGSAALEDMTWAYMRWFYGRMDKLYVGSRCYRDVLARQGFALSRLALLPRGVDAAFFNPAKREPHFWKRWDRFGAAPGFKFLYVGRVSREKNLDALLAAFDAFLASGRAAQLAVVGDGPYLEELARRHRRPEILFTGFLHGEDLARAYAGADLFVFPSATDTFGNVVLEAQASGLAAIVSHQGGPQELVAPLNAGLVVDMGRPGELARAMIRLHDDGGLRQEMAARAVAGARRKSWERLLDRLWHEEGAAPPALAENAAEEADDDVAALVGPGPTTISAWRALAS